MQCRHIHFTMLPECSVPSSVKMELRRFLLVVYITEHSVIQTREKLMI